MHGDDDDGVRSSGGTRGRSINNPFSNIFLFELQRRKLLEASKRHAHGDSRFCFKVFLDAWLDQSRSSLFGLHIIMNI